MEQLSGKEAKQEEIDKLSKLEDVLMLNPAIKEFFLRQNLDFLNWFKMLITLLGGSYKC